MQTTCRASLLFISCAFVCVTSHCVAARNSSAARESATSAGLNLKSGGGLVREWVVLGPLPNPQPEKGRGTPGAGRGGFDHDYLQSLGGEEKARLKPGMLLTATDPKGTPSCATD